MGHHKRVLHDVCGRVRSREGDGDDEAGSGEAQQRENKQFSLPTGKQILEH